ncbi:MAG: hypothetical protein BWZ11_00184 [Bacteroidetes bacterium ADurb.BinA395]|jgi:hypothetical protein|nr:MAG: hypothetical protein BWZ11_00184 [Bacteroidetes bacterium ADurb.BinA395]
MPKMIKFVLIFHKKLILFTDKPLILILKFL